MSLIVLVAALVVISGLPCEKPDSKFLVVLIGAFVHIAVLVIKSFLPFSFAVLEAVLEFTSVDASVLPFVLALSLRFSMDVYACENVTIGEEV